MSSARLETQRTTPSTLLVIVSFVSLYLGWGSTYLAIRISLESLPPLMIGAIRHLTAGVILYLLTRYTGAVRPEPRHWGSAFILGALLLLGGNGAVIIAQQRVPSGLAALMVSILPITLTFLGWVSGREPLPTGKLRWVLFAGLLGGLVGMALLIDMRGTQVQGMATQVPVADAVLLLFASVSWAAGSLYSREAAAPRSVTMFTGMQMLAGGVLMLGAAALRGELVNFSVAAVTPRSLVATFYLIVVGGLIAFNAYIWLLKHRPPSQVATYAYVNPVIAVFLGWALANEPMTFRTLVASAIIIGSVALIVTSRREPKVRSQPGA